MDFGFDDFQKMLDESGINFGSVVRDVMYGRCAEAISEQDTVERMERAFRKAFGHDASKAEWDRFSGVVLLLVLTTIDGMGRLLDVVDNAEKGGEAIREEAARIIENCIETAAGFPDSSGIDLYADNETEMLVSSEGDKLPESVVNQISKEIGVPAEVIREGVVILGKSSDVDDLVDAIRGVSDNSNMFEKTESSVNDMLERARKAKAERG